MSDMMRYALIEASKRADYSKPAFVKQREAINMNKLREDLEIVATRMLVLTTAFTAIEELGMHPMQAFLYAIDVESPMIATHEFFTILETWAKLCAPASGVQQQTSFFESVIITK
jgi:hypothetical protein